VVGAFNDNPEGTLAMLGGSGPSTLDIACGYFQVIGTQNGTTVTITPTVTTQGGKHPGVYTGAGANWLPQPYTISLNKGQCYMVKSACENNQYDITGSIVESDKPIAVISGHENAGIGNVGGRTVEGRDYMVEQMMPVEHWASTGYVSIPYVDSDPYNGHATGENYRIITYDSAVSNVSFYQAGFAGAKNYQLERYKSEDAFEVEVPVDFVSDSIPFMVYQIDQTNQSSKQPFPRPSMAQIIPISRWKNAYLWFVPSNVDERLQAYYINIIAPKAKFDSIFVSKGGQKDVLIGQAGLSVVKVYQNIPNHPELIGKTFKVVPGSYYSRATFPFIIYHYGNRAIDADGDLGDFDNDDNFFSYALPLGYQFTAPVSGSILIDVDTLCSSWKVCVTDMKVGGYISSATMLDDPNADIIIPPSGHAPYVASNIVFDATDDPNNTREIIFKGTDSSICFNVKVEDPTKDAYGPIMIVNGDGNTRIIELSFKKAAVEITPDPLMGGSFGLRMVGTDTDSTFMFVNLPASSRNYVVSDVSLIGDDTLMKIISVKPALPATIELGDTLKYTVRFSSRDTVSHFDSIRLVTDCSTTLIPLIAEGGCGIITTSDHDFGNVIVGSTACTDTVRIRNIGKLPFTLTHDYLLQDTSIFSLYQDRVVTSSNREVPLPLVLQPGDFVRARICYRPKDEGADSTALIWKTDIPSPYTLSQKTFTVLRGSGIMPGVHWDIDTGYMRMDLAETRFMRRFLVNSSTAEIRIDSVFIQGIDASEFKIAKLQNALEFGIDTHDSVFVDISVTPDLTKPANYLRRAQVIATNTFDKSEADTLQLIAGFNVLKVSQELQLEELLIHPNPSLGEDVIASFGLAEPKELRFEVYDMLGRVVYSTLTSYFAQGKQSVMLPVSKLGEGGYVLHISDGAFIRSIGFRVVK
ncbi:MAG TPA: T9SS type A sorting domain-containing protein, partial [Candidatus Kapabacteria bacterium]